MNPIFSPVSDGGVFVTDAEFSQIMQNPLPGTATSSMVEKFLLRLNNTFYNWQSGIVNGSDMVDSDRFTNALINLKTLGDEAIKVS